MSTKYETLIIGAGPAGMAVAMELYSNGKDFTVVEKSEYVGGLAKRFSTYARFIANHDDTWYTKLEKG